MTNTTEDMNKAFADAMRQELAFHAKGAKKRFEDAQAKIIADIQTNPASAITWLAEDMVQAQTQHEVWLRIERQMVDHDPREVLKTNLEDVQYRVRAFFGSNSTSVFDNAVERAKAQAYLRQAEQLEGLCKHYGI
jgi:hypothetical protein